MLSREATNTNFIVFSLTRPGLEPTNYHTQGQHANHYTTDTVICVNIMDIQFSVYSLVYVCQLTAKHAALRRKSKDWLAWNQNNVFGLLFQ
jgi:hypothetical protein